MKYITISKSEILSGDIALVSSENDTTTLAHNILKPGGLWRTERRNSAVNEFVIIDYGQPSAVNFIELIGVSDTTETFPKDFRFEHSDDMQTWHILHTEIGYEPDGKSCFIYLPITVFRYLKLTITKPGFFNERYYVEITSLNAGIGGINDVTVSSSIDNEHGPHKLFDGKQDSFWASSIQTGSASENIKIDLGNPYTLNQLILSSTNMGFPEDFHVEVSLDKELWTTLLEVKRFKAEANKRYYWDINVIPARYIRLEAENVRLQSGQFGLQISGIDICAAQFEGGHIHNIGESTLYASVFQAGVVKLAKDGDDTAGAAVQGNDCRLRDATTIFKGITQLASDGETEEGLVVQASDSRIKPASEDHQGIVRLAADSEMQPGAAVQGNDSRLKPATTDHAGIVRICPDGLYSDQSVITGNDSRLHKATISNHGIVRLANDGENISGTAVQGNDRRLKDATTLAKGIVELAEDGETTADTVVQGNDRRLKDATTSSKGIVELAEDGEETAGTVIQGNDHRLKDATTSSKGIVELAEDGEVKAGTAVQSIDNRLKDATTSSKGIVQLAENGEVAEGTVVQGNDRRLRDGSELHKGIVRFAKNGEESEEAAVQGNDQRLRDATTSSKGIVELAEDGETTAGTAIQGNDRRLNDATTSSKGIVELAEDGESRNGVAVQGSDRRLREATETEPGIVRLAQNGENNSNTVVQGNDRRLRDATTLAKGIVELAEDGETTAGTVIQGNDRRLKDATTLAKGIVELAEDGEDTPGAVVQGNDSRLKKADVDIYGIVKLAASGETRSGYVIQSDDERLSDPREPLPHQHDYAPKNHQFDNHSGTLSITDSKNELFNSITPPSNNSSIVYAKNTSSENGAIGVVGITGILQNNATKSYGVVGHSGHIGVRGQSTGDADSGTGCGILGVSRFGAGGLFTSEHGFALVADGYGDINNYDDSLKLIGSGKALSVNGNAEFHGTIKFMKDEKKKENAFPIGTVEMFEVDEIDYIAPGDVLVVSQTGKSRLSRSKKEYDKSVIGIVSGNPALLFNNSGKEEKVYPIVLSGKAMCKVDARNNPVKPGDLIVTSSTPGCAMVGKMDSFDKIGTVIGKALDSLDDGIELIPVFITHQ